MASKSDKTSLAAQKARKQKIIAIVGGVLLLGIVAIQGPKLWKQLNPPTPKQTSAVVTPTPVTPVTAAAPPISATPATGSTATVVLAGVSVPNGKGAPPAQDGKLATFSLFEVKDPFVPQASDIPKDAASAGSTAAAPATQPGSTPASAGGITTPAATAPPPTHATIEVNGKAQKLGLKQKFPTGNPTFVLVSLKPSSAKVGVAGGSFKSGKQLSLQLGQQATVVDSTTGNRYVLKLVYTGTEPEQTATFASAAGSSSTTKTP